MEMKGLYCITGFVKAAEKFEREPGANAEFETQLKKAHISESTNLIEESSIIELLYQRVAGHCVSKVFYAMKAEYQNLNFSVSENCLRCAQICH